jgi:hypothetical protein
MKRISRLLIAMLSLYTAALWGAGPQARPATTVGSTDTMFVHIADGGQWITSFTLINIDAIPAPFTLSFYDDNGLPLALSIGGTSATSVSNSISIGGSMVVQTDGGPVVRQGWASLSTTGGKIAGTAVFRSHLADRADDFEAAVPLASQVDHRFIIAFDNTSGFVTGIALANPDPVPSAAQIVVTFRDESGTQIVTRPLSLAAKGHTAFLVDLNYPETAGKRGVVEFNSVNHIAGLGLRYIKVSATGSPLVTAAFTSTSPFTNSTWP